MLGCKAFLNLSGVSNPEGMRVWQALHSTMNTKETGLYPVHAMLSWMAEGRCRVTGGIAQPGSPRREIKKMAVERKAEAGGEPRTGASRAKLRIALKRGAVAGVHEVRARRIAL